MLCKSNKRIFLDYHTGFIFKSNTEGQTVLSIARQLKPEVCQHTISNIRQHVTQLAKKHGLKTDPKKSRGPALRLLCGISGTP